MTPAIPPQVFYLKRNCNPFLLCIAFAFLVSMPIGKAQHPCGTQQWTPEYRKFKESHFPGYAGLRNDVTNKIPMKAHIVRMSDGTGGMTLQELTTAISFANVHYKTADIEFFICEVEYIDDDDYYDFDTEEPDNDTEEGLIMQSTESTEAINAYFMNSLAISSGTICGYARFPFDALSSNRTLMDKDCAAGSDNGTFVHELGHYFSLPHTHAGTENGPTDPDAENVDRDGPNANCDTAGDLMCDTEADPKAYDDEGMELCIYEDDSMDIHGVIYEPPLDNIMSYWADFCGGFFTTEQYTMIGMGLTERLGHTTYSLDCTPTAVTTPSDLVVENLCGDVTLMWTDNASNEYGYLIERSEVSASAGFEALPGGATGPDVTTYSDATAGANMDYWYRVKAVNGDPDAYSNVSMITLGQTYCEATTSTSCASAREYIDSVSIADIMHNSGCSEEGFECFTNIQTALAKESAYPIYVEIGNYFNSTDSVHVYFDWNQDGDFEDADEMFALEHGGTPINTGNIMVPASALTGTTTMRVRVQYTPNHDPAPCGHFSFSEAEDYSLDVTEPLPVSLLTFNASAENQASLLEWTTTRENRNAGFEVHHSTDGTRYTRIDFVKANTGGYTDIHHYQFVHHTPAGGKNFYKLRQVDFDGGYTDSPIREVRFDPIAIQVSIFPNPATDRIQIAGVSPETPCEVMLIGAEQRLLRRWVFEEVGNWLELDISNLPHGWYLLSIVQGDRISRKALVIGE